MEQPELKWDDLGVGTMTDAEATTLYFGFSEQVKPGEGVESEDLSPEEEDDDVESEEGEEEVRRGPTEEMLTKWESGVEGATGGRKWKEHPFGMMQSTCFAVEWRGSVLLDKQVFIRKLLLLVGGDASFVMGCEIRRSRADYTVVVRMKKRVRWREWRRKLMFGHASDGEEEGLFMRVRVPLVGTDQGINAFIGQMKRRCEVYEETSRYKEGNLIRVRDMSFDRPGRRSGRAA